MLDLGQFASPPVFVEQMGPKCCVESCNDFWGVSHGPVLVVVQWSYVVPVLLGYNSIALMHQGKALINICPSQRVWKRGCILLLVPQSSLLLVADCNEPSLEDGREVL